MGIDVVDFIETTIVNTTKRTKHFEYVEQMLASTGENNPITTHHFIQNDFLKIAIDKYQCNYIIESKANS